MAESETLVVDADVIQKMVVDRIRDSVIGETIKQVIEREVGKSSYKFQEGVEAVVKKTMADVVQSIIDEKWLTQIREYVTTKMTDEFLKLTFERVWTAWEERLWR